MARPEQERTLTQKAMDAGFSAFSLVTLPFWVVTGIGAAAVGSWWLAGGAGLMATSDVVTIKETFEPRKSFLNPSRLVDHFIGRNRLGGNQRLS